MYDAGNAKHVDARQKKAKLEQREQDAFFKAALSTTQGRRFFFELLSRCKLHQSSFNSDPGKMAFAEGERNIGLMLQADIVRVYPEALILMMREADERSRTDNGPGGDNDSSGDTDDADGDTAAD